MKRLIVHVVLVGAVSLPLAACDQPEEGPAERAGKQVDEALEDTKEAIEDSVERAGDKLEQAGDTIEQKTDN